MNREILNVMKKNKNALSGMMQDIGDLIYEV
jgi:hypothetical protein